MTGSMYAAIAGLQTHMQKMNVIGNNIANANTVGFKPGVTVFSESLYTAINNSTAGGNQYGGTNAAQIGYGSQLGTIDLNMTTGSYQPTGVNSHLYLNGNGFFLTGPKPENAAEYQENPNDLELTRVGQFSLDNDGYLVDANGHCVYGFLPKGDPTTGKLTDPIEWDGCLRPLRIPVAAPPKQDPNDTTMPDEGDANITINTVVGYDVTAQTSEHGEIVFSRDVYAAGETVSFTFNPTEPKYSIKNVTYEGAEDGAVSYDPATRRGSFIMPEKDVHLTFEEDVLASTNITLEAFDTEILSSVSVTGNQSRTSLTQGGKTGEFLVGETVSVNANMNYAYSSYQYGVHVYTVDAQGQETELTRDDEWSPFTFTVTEEIVSIKVAIVENEPLVVTFAEDSCQSETVVDGVGQQHGCRQYIEIAR